MLPGIVPPKAIRRIAYAPKGHFTLTTFPMVGLHSEMLTTLWIGD